MSRCFPYPPPGYMRNPVAVAEAETTAKLQKEREKAEKKKEKRSDKKSLLHGEMAKHSKHSHKKRKHEDVGTAGQEPKKFSSESVEQLEKSGLSEELGAPYFIQTVRDSPESSQDSSKRRKVVLPSPSQAKNGNIVRIKIKSNQDSQAAVLEKFRVPEQPSVQIGSSSQLSKLNSIQRHNKSNGRSSAAQQRIDGNSPAVQNRAVTEPPAKVMHRIVPQPAVKVTQPVDPQLSVKAAVGRSDLPPKCLGRVDPSPARAVERSDPQPVNMTQRVQHPPAKILQKDLKLPSEEIQRKSSAVGTKVAQKESRSPAVGLPEASQFPLLQKPKDLPVFKQQQEPITSLPKEEKPCSSGRNAESAPVKELKLSRSDRKKIRKAEKKEMKYRDLFVTWNPVPADTDCSDLGEQDWLFGSTRNTDASMSCRASDCSVPFQLMEQPPSLQPRATLLPDLHIYQLPYVVPF